MTMKKEVRFAPGCFDHFEGTQEELDELQNYIREMFSNMSDDELMEIASPIEDMPEELREALENPEHRKLQ